VAGLRCGVGEGSERSRPARSRRAGERSNLPWCRGGHPNSGLHLRRGRVDNRCVVASVGSHRLSGSVAALRLAVLSALAGAGCGHSPATVSRHWYPDTPDRRLTACMVSAGYEPSSSFRILREFEHGRLVAGTTLTERHVDRQVVIYDADSDGQIAGVGAAMASSGLRVVAILDRHLVGVTSDWLSRPPTPVLKRCAIAAARGRGAPRATSWP
jgi:hypothetical protein